MIIIRKVNFFKEITCKNKKIMVIFISVADRSDKKEFGSMVKRLRHRPFTAVTRVRFPLESSDHRSVPKGLRTFSSVG